MRASRNKTIDLEVSEGEEYLSRCIRPTAKQDIDSVINRTACGDCMEILPLLPEGFADLLIADPPYNMSKYYNGTLFAKQSENDYAEFTESWLLAALPKLKKTASVYVCCDWRSSSAVYEVLKKHLIVRNRITWQREKGRGAQKNWKNASEDIWFATVSDEYTFNVEAVKHRRRVLAPYRAGGVPKDWEETELGRFRNTYPSNFWDDITVPYWSMPENTAHPTQKPEKLLAKLILASSNADDTVLDPFLGSGSTSVAAKKLGRRYVGIEREERYCVWAEKRLEMADGNSSIQGYTDGVFWERNSIKTKIN